VYEVTISGTAVKALDDYLPENTLTTTFELTILDPCDPSTITNLPELTNQVYTITDEEMQYTVPTTYIINPYYCEVETGIDITPTAEGNTAIP
jgi:hypothetical protein